MHDPSNPAKKAYSGNNYQLRVIVRYTDKTKYGIGAATASVGFGVK
jgi:hypothetical protein